MAQFLEHEPWRVTFPVYAVRQSSTASPTQRGETNGHVATQILVVARDQPDLYESVRRAFAGNPTLEVVLDRRRAERRRAERVLLPEGRRSDRRVTLEADAQLRTLGWAIVRCDVARSLGRLHLNGSR